MDQKQTKRTSMFDLIFVINDICDQLKPLELVIISII